MNIDGSVEVGRDGQRPFIYREDKSDRKDRENDDYEGEWTLRKASAYAIANLSNPYADDVLEIVSPYINVFSFIHSFIYSFIHLLT